MSDASVIPNPLLSAAIARPEHPYVNDLTFGELRARAQRRASALAAVSLGRPWVGARVGLRGAYDERWLEWAFSLNWLGATVAPIKPEASEAERRALAELLSLDEVIELRDGEARGAHLGSLSEEALCTAPSAPPVDWAWERVIFALTTSGSTGSPKPVLLTTRALTLSAFGSMVRLGHLMSDRWLACLPLHHVGGLSIFVRALLQQTSVSLCAAKGPALAAALASGAHQLCSLTPTLLRDCLDALERLDPSAREGLSELRALLVGGARTDQETWRRATTLGLPVRLTWGMSEAASQVCTQLSPAPPGGAIPPLPLQGVSLSSEGCLTLSSPTTEVGYYETQDLGQLDERGWVRVTGRRDDVIISGGVNIHPREIEERLLEHPSVADVAVIGASDERWGQALHAHLRLAEGAACPSHEDLRDWCRAQLSPHKCPKAFHWRDALPRDPLGKLQRRHLINPSQESEGSP